MSDISISTQKLARAISDLSEQLSPSELRSAIKSSYEGVARKAHGIALARLRSKNFQVQGNKADFEKALRYHIYSGGGGFLVTVQPRSNRSAGGEVGMHENRYYGRTGRKMPILKWLEFGSYKGERMTRGTRRRPTQHSTGHLKAAHFLTDSEPQMVSLVEREEMKELGKALEHIASESSK